MVTNLKRWALPPSYFGATWKDYYVAASQHRDSDSITRSNWLVTCAAVPETGAYDPDDPTSGVIIVRESHWACGWIEWLAIHETCTAALAIADGFAERLENYPILDESAHSALEWDETAKYWEHASVSERVSWLQRARLSVFAARRASLPDDDAGRLYELLTGF